MKATLFFSVLVLVGPAMAFPKFLKSFSATYPQAAPATCVVCHTDVTNALNSYGLATQKHLSAEVIDFKSIETLDSDEDSFSNIEEISAGSLPGDKDSTPSRP